MKRYCTLKIRLEGLQERTCCYALWRCHQLRRTSTPPIANAQNATPPPLGDWSHRQLCGASAEHTKTLHKLLIIVHFDDVTNNNLFSIHCQWSSCNTSISWWFSSSAEQTIQLLINCWLLYTLTKSTTTINLFSTHFQCSSWKNSTSWWFSSSSTVWSFYRANNTTEYYRLLIITDYCKLRQYHQFQSLLHSLKIFGWQHFHLSVIQLILSSMALLQSTHYNSWSGITEPAITLTIPIPDSMSSLPQTCVNYYYNEFYNYLKLHSVKIWINYIYNFWGHNYQPRIYFQTAQTSFVHPFFKTNKYNR